jgi:perosamine synthetase
MRIPVAAPDLAGNEVKYVLDAVRSSWISSTGQFVDRFEREFADLCGTRTAVCVANGTAALHVALLSLGTGPGDEVITPSLSYVATANAVRYVGAEPVFVDIDPTTWCIRPALIESAVTPRTKGIIAVHLYGHPSDMDAINTVAAKHGLWVVEDAAEAHFARYNGRPVGGLGTIGTFSFYGNKVITSGEGGAITLNDPALERRVRMLRGQGMDPERRYFFPIIGYNYRLTNVACALLCAQLERKDAIIAQRQRVFAAYRALLEGTPGIGFQPVAPWAEPTPWMFCITVDERGFGCSRNDLMDHLADKEIETRPFFIPIHTLPPYQSGPRWRSILPVAEQLGATGINLPTYGGMSSEEITWVARAIRAYGPDSVTGGL